MTFVASAEAGELGGCECCRSCNCCHEEGDGCMFDGDLHI